MRRKNDKNNIVYKLSYSASSGYYADEIQTYGMDVSTITEAILNQIPRNKEVDKSLTTLFDFIDEGKTKEALKLLDELKQQFGDSLPDLAKAETMLNFISED